jgi:hypothetical protein
MTVIFWRGFNDVPFFFLFFSSCSCVGHFCRWYQSFGFGHGALFELPESKGARGRVAPALRRWPSFEEVL